MSARGTRRTLWSPAAEQTGEQRDDKDRQENIEQDLRDSCCRAGDAAETEDRRNYRDHHEY